MTMIGYDKNGACPPGHCDLGYNRDGTRLCRKCGFTTQTLADGVRRHPMPGDYRLVCHGPKGVETDACPIGPSEATPHQTTAIEAMNDHQNKAERMLYYCEKCGVAVPGGFHDAEIVQFPLEDD